MSGRDRIVARLTAGETSASRPVAVLVTGLAIVAVFVALGLVTETVYAILPRGVAFTGVLVTLAVLGFGGLYLVVRVNDWLG